MRLVNKSEWSEEEWSIFRLFNFMCGVCRISPAVTLHEIHPKSKRPKTWKEPKNRIPVCSSCHDRIHKEGINAKTIKILQDLRKSAENASGNNPII